MNGIFFGSQDGYIYGIDFNGNNLSGWPVNITGDNTESEINSSPVFADIDNDGDIDILDFDVNGLRIEYHKNLSVENFSDCDSGSRRR